MRITKEEKIALFESYMVKANTTNVHITPAENSRLKAMTGRGIDSGSHGKSAELITKTAVNGHRGMWYKVARNDKGVDFKHKGIKYQVKCGCGSWAYDSEKLPFEYVVYAPFGLVESDMCMVIPAREFDSFVREVITLKKNSHNGYNIQSWKNSKKKTKALFDFLSDYPTFEEYFG